MTETDISAQLAEQVRQAAALGTPLKIQGGNSKACYGRETEGELLDLLPHQGIVEYEPTELVITARAGTPLAEIEALLAEHNQMLPFEAPCFDGQPTLGGVVASGLSGPRRPWGGAPRDLVLGVRLLDGEGRILHFGGRVMKNVAGYDVSRLMAGSLGTLGVLLEISLKVLPQPAAELSRVLELDRATAMGRLRRYAQHPIPLSGACHLDGKLYLRLSGNESGVNAWLSDLGGEELDNGFWRELRDHRLPFFGHSDPLWRLSLPPAAEPLGCEKPVLVDWGGAQRWVNCDHPAEEIRRQVATVNGHATLFRGGDRNGEVFHPLDTVRMRIHQGLKRTFDPQGILNPGRMYPNL